MEQRGTVPKEQQLLLIVAACQKAGDNNCVSKVFEKLVQHYPKPEYWQNLMVALKATDTDDIQTLNVMLCDDQYLRHTRPRLCSSANSDAVSLTMMPR